MSAYQTSQKNEINTIIYALYKNYGASLDYFIYNFMFIYKTV